jgi:hypothetical protein
MSVLRGITDEDSAPTTRVAPDLRRASSSAVLRARLVALRQVAVSLIRRPVCSGNTFALAISVIGNREGPFREDFSLCRATALGRDSHRTLSVIGPAMQVKPELLFGGECSSARAAHQALQRCCSTAVDNGTSCSDVVSTTLQQRKMHEATQPTTRTASPSLPCTGNAPRPSDGVLPRLTLG